MRGNYHVVLDACVLARATLSDLFLRLAETPRLYSPHWSVKILDEACKHYATRPKRPWPAERIASFKAVLQEHFPEAFVHGYEWLEPALDIHPKDKHVLAAAIHAKIQAIVTFNLKDFQSPAIGGTGVEVVHPSEYLTALYSMDSGVFVSKLTAMASKKKIEPPALLTRLAKSGVPIFAAYVADELGWNLNDSGD